MPTGLGDEQLWLSATNDNTGTSTAFNDQSGNGNNGTASGTLVVADTSEGGSYAYDFDGTNDYIDVVSSGVPATAYSVSLWQYSTSSSVNTAFNAGGTKRTVNIDAVRAGTSGDNHGHKSSGSSYWVTNNTNRSSATWYHYLLTYDGGTLRLYVDGVLIDSRASVPNTTYTETKCWIGQFIGNGSFFQGRMDDIRTYDRALTQAEITHLASSRGVEGPPPVGLGDEQLWLCPSLNDSASDISGNENNGTLTGGTAIVSDSGSGGTKSFESYTTSTDRVDIPAGVFTDGNDVSVSLWVKNKQTSAGSKVRNIFRSTNSDIQLYANQTRYRGVAGGVTAEDTLVNLNTTEYYHYALNYDNASSSIELFRNGVSVATASGAAATTLSGTLDLLQNSIAFVDDVRAYNRVLTQSDISWLATERGVLGTPPEGLGDEQLWLCPSIQDGANDLSGNGNDGVIGSSITTVADTSNGGTLAYNFPDTAGTNTITINDFDLGGLSQLTWSAWIYDESDNAASTHSSFFSWRRTGGSGNDDILFFNYERSLLSFQLNNGTDGGATYTPVYYQNWKHYCVVFDGTNPTATDRLNLYVNGVLQTPDTTFSYPATTASPSGTPFAEIGDYVGSSNHGLFNFKGKQDDIRTYERALTQAEITHLATSRGIEGSPSTPTAQYNAFATHAFKQLFQTRLR